MDEIKSIENANVKELKMPVGMYVQEAEDLYYWAIEDKSKLEAVGFPGGFLDELLSRAGALRETQSKWARIQRLQDEAGAEWKKLAPGAYEFRDDLLADFRF
jgi:hypothetical protein